MGLKMALQFSLLTMATWYCNIGENLRLIQLRSLETHPSLKMDLIIWCILKIVCGFLPHTASLKVLETYTECNFLILKEEGNTSPVCQSFYQDASKQDKVRFRDYTYFLCLCIPETRGVLNS